MAKWFGVLGLMLLAGLAQAASPVHPTMANTGPNGRLEIATRGHALAARLTLPESQVLDFALPASNKKQTRELHTALARLGKALNVLVPDAAAHCTISDQSVKPPKGDPDNSGDMNRGGKLIGDHDFHAKYDWHCDDPQALKSVTVPLLEYMNGMALDALVISEQGERTLILHEPADVPMVWR